MSNNSADSNMHRTVKLIACALATLIGFCVVTLNLIYPQQFDYGIGNTIIWLLVYIPMAIVVGDVLKTIKAGSRTLWVIGVLCMPIVAIPFYIAMHGK
jgi:hypothetical protein